MLRVRSSDWVSSEGDPGVEPGVACKDHWLSFFKDEA